MPAKKQEFSSGGPNQPPNTESGFERSAKRLIFRQKRFLNRRVDEIGVPRDDVWREGVKQLRRMRVDVTHLAAPGPAAPPAPVVAGGVRWKQIGPQPLKIDARQNFQGSGPDSGEVVDIAIDRRGATDQVIYIATNDGGIWKTTDGGANWAPKTDFMPSLSMGAVALDPTNPDIVYAGTGNPFDGGGVFSKGVGIYRSTDDGETWLQLGEAVLKGMHIRRIVMPGGDVLLVATENGVFRSVDGGQHFGANAPKFDDGNSVLAGDVTDLQLDTATPASTAYACVRGVGILVSTNGGITFAPGSNLFNNPGAPAAGTYSRIIFAQSTTESGGRHPGDTLYAAVSDTAPDPAGVLLGLFKSTDRGANWTPMPDALTRAAQSATDGGGSQQINYNLTLGVDPLNDQRVYLAFQELFVSTDGANNFSTPAVSLNQIHFDNHALTFSPHAPGGAAPMPVYAGTDGGIALSSDGGATWSNLNSDIATNLMLGIDIGRSSAANNGITYGGCQDTGTVERLPAFSGTDWHLGEDGDGGPVAVDTANPQRAYGRTNGRLMITNNGGTAWTFPTATGPTASGLPAEPGTGLSLGTPLAVDLNTAANVYVAQGNQLFQSTNSGVSFTAINTFPATIRAFALVKADSKIAMVGCSDGSVHRTTNLNAGAGAIFANLSATITAVGAPGLPVGGIAIDPTDTSTAVVVFDGFTLVNRANRTNHVFRTTDGGANWSDISGTDGAANPDENFPDLPAHSVVIDPTGAPHPIIVAIDSGVIRSTDNGATWQIFGVGLPAVDCTSLAIDAAAAPPVIRLGTYGRSVFELERPTGPAIAVRGNLAFGSVAQGASADLTVQVFNVGTTDLILNDFFDLTGAGDFALVAPPPFPLTISPGAEADFTVRFSPTKGGDQTAPLSITSNDAAQPAFAVRASGSSPISVPQITALVPPTGPAAGGTAVQIQGNKLTGATGVLFGATGATSFTVDSDIQISAVNPPGSGVVDVVVTAPTGSSVPSPSSRFTYAGGGPVVTGLAPSDGPETGGTAVVISGSGFASATQVLFGAFAASGFTADSDSQITAVSPAGSGVVDVMVAAIAGTSPVSPADKYRYTVPGGGIATGGAGGGTGTGAGVGPGAPTGDEDVLHALADILRTGTDPDILEAQRILLRRIALEGNIIDSRVPPPKNITEIGGYINLLTTLGHTDIRTEMLASVLGVAGPATPVGLSGEAPALAFIPMPNDRPTGNAQATITTAVTVRSDLADAFALAMQRVHGFGCALPLYTPPRVLPKATPGLIVQPDLLQILGRVLQVSPGALLADPSTDAVAIARLTSDPPDRWQLVVQEIDGQARITPASWVAYQAGDTNVTALPPAPRQYLPIAALLADAGWYSSQPFTAPTSVVAQGSLPRLVNVTGLVRGHTRLGDELSLLYSQTAIMASALAGQLSWVWNGTTFVPSL